MPDNKENISSKDSPDFLSFNQLYNEYQQGFVRFAMSYLGDREASEDYVAESFMAYWNNREKLLPDSNIRAYILTVLKNKCLNHLRQEDYRNRLVRKMGDNFRWELDMRISTLEACDPNEVFSEEIREIVRKSVQSLPSRTMEVFLLSRSQHKSNKEIAEMLGISVKGVEFHITKALDILRQELKDYLPALLLLLLM